MGIKKPMEHILIVSALLHDIGKFAQRAGRPKSDKLINSYCKPTQQGWYAYTHVLYTDYCIEHDLPLPDELMPYRSLIARCAAAHHKPGIGTAFEEQLAEYILQKADWLSSGLDRIEDNSERHQFDRAHLQSVFSDISLDKTHGIRTWHKLQAIGHDKAIFPCAEKEAQAKDYAQLFAAFCQAAQNLPLHEGTWAYIASLSSLLEQYTYCIPSCTYHTQPDISLFDHSITTAAIAQALWHTALGQGITSIAALPELKLYLFGAEFSGIQKYIFTGTGGKGFTRILRARSFHLQALTRGLVVFVLDKLNLLPIAKIMEAGGKCILLLPHTEQVKQSMPALMQEIETYFAQNFSGELKVPMALLELDQKEMEQSVFADKLDALNDALETSKFSPFTSYLQKHSPVFDMTFPQGLCAYCERKPAEAIAEEKGICKECAALIEIGKFLPHSHYGLFTKICPQAGQRLKLMGDLYFVLDAGKDFAPAEIAAALDCINIKDRNKYTNYAITGFIPAQDNGTSMTFEDMAQAAIIREQEQERCVPMLGIVKADVDNLGLIFSLGFQEKLSVSRFANLSRMLNIFFSEHLVQRIQQENLCIYTVFTGGDDLFVLGSWTDSIQFSSLLHKEFAQFTSNNPNCTLSAGIVFAKPKLPIGHIAKMAEDALKLSKNYGNHAAKKACTDNTQTAIACKNACTLFDRTCSWAQFEKELAQGAWLESTVQEKKISQGFVRRLLVYAEECKDFLAQGDIKKGLYTAHLKYDIARNIDDEAFDIKKNIETMTSAQEFQNSRIAISYALYKTRSW